MAGVLDSARFATFIAMELGVSVKEIDDVARKVMSAGGGAKLCGAGGGGMMLVYHDDKALLKKEINSLGYELIDVKLGNGRIVLYGFPPQLRGQTHSTFKFLFNALFP